MDGEKSVDDRGEKPAPIAPGKLQNKALSDRPPNLWQQGAAVLLKRRLFISIVTLFALALGSAYCGFTEPVYRASALAEVIIPPAASTDEGTDPLANRAALDARIETRLALLRSPSFSSSLAEEFNLANHPAFADQSLPSGTRTDQARNRLAESLRVERQGDSRIISVTAFGPDPRLPAQIVNRWVESFINDETRKLTAPQTETRGNLQTRLDALEVQLDIAENALASAAADRNMPEIMGSETSGSLSENEATNRDRWFALNEAYREASLRRLQAEQLLQQATSAPETLGNAAYDALRSERRAVEIEFQENATVLRENHPDMKKLTAQIETMDQQISTMKAEIVSRYQMDVSNARREETRITSEIDTIENTLRETALTKIDLEPLQRQVDVVRVQYDAVLAELTALSANERAPLNSLSLISAAEPAAAPYSPNWTRTLLIALVTGFGLSLIGVLIKEKLDDKLKSPGDIERKLGLTVLGVVPAVRKAKTVLSQATNPRSTIGEAVAAIRSNIDAITKAPTGCVLHVTSTRSDEGKSTIVYALGKSFADAGKRTIIVDADMRLPTFRSDLDGEEDIGLADILSGQDNTPGLIRPTQAEGLYLLSCGARPDNPAALLASPRFKQVLARLSSQFDRVIVDSPPVLGLADAPTIGGSCHATLYIVEFDSIRRGHVRAAMNRLIAGGAKPLGIIISKYQAKQGEFIDADYYSYGRESQSYGEDAPSGRGLLSRLRKRKPRKQMDITNLGL